MSDGSEALVTGPGSLWSIRADLAVGLNSANNRLVVSNGAAVVSGNNGRVGVSGPNTGNQVLVTGAGSSWSNQFELYVGEGNVGNRLEVNSGGRVVSSNTYVGYQSASNFALITGASSLLSNRAGMYVGHSSSANQLVVSNGAVAADGFGRLGYQPGASNNVAVVTGAGSLWANSGDLRVGDSGAGNQLVVSNSGVVANGYGYLGFNSTSSNNVALVTGAGSRWTNQSDLYLGNSGAGNQLVVSDGGVVRNVNAQLGANTTSSNNVAVVTGAGSLWTHLSVLSVGLTGAGNQLVVSNGGVVQALVGYVGNGSSRNGAVVTGAGSRWANQSDLTVGYSGAGNQLVVSNGGLVVNSNGYLGNSLSGSTNMAVVTGAGSLWSNAGNLNVGYSGAGSQLIVSNGGTVFASNAVYLGFNSSSTDNRLITGGGTLRVTNTAGTGVFDLRRGTNVLNAGLMDIDQLLLTNRGTIAIPSRFGNASSNFIPNLGTASAYPSTIAVAGLAGLVTKVSVTLSNLSAGIPDDLDILLVSPAGKKVMLMSDAGGSTILTNVRLTFDDTAATLLPDSALPTNGTYLPTDYEPGETLPSPAPPGPYATTLSSFNGSDPNGVWSLYIVDDANAFGSSSLVGWGLQITTDGLFFDPGVFEFNGGTLVTRGASINNARPFVVGGPGGIPAVWDVRAGVSNHFLAHTLIVGSNSSFNQLLITNGALLTNRVAGFIGYNAGDNSNAAFVSGAGSQWGLSGLMAVGYDGAFNRLVVSNGGVVLMPFGSGVIGYLTNANSNAVVVTDAASRWEMGELVVGLHGAFNQLVISNGGSVISSYAVLGANATSTNNRAVVDGGTLRATNAAGTGHLDVRRGTNVLNAGLIEVDQLLVTNAQGFFEFNGGTLIPRATTNNNGRVFTVGNGASAATLRLLGGTHSFANGLVIANNATLTGNGTVVGAMAVSSGGTLSPGDGIGTLVFSNTPSLGGTIIIEAFKIGATKFNDQIQVAGTILYGGSLTVSNVGVTAFAAGDNFKLFNATAYGSSFASLNLPPLNAGLGWTNKLTVDGSIEVIVVAVSQPKFGSITLSGTNVIISGTNGTAGANYAVLTATNVTLPSSNWTSIVTNLFGPNGEFSFTNGIAPGTPQRYFRLRSP